MRTLPHYRCPPQSGASVAPEGPHRPVIITLSPHFTLGLAFGAVYLVGLDKLQWIQSFPKNPLAGYLQVQCVLPNGAYMAAGGQRETAGAALSPTLFFKTVKVFDTWKAGFY